MKKVLLVSTTTVALAIALASLASLAAVPDRPPGVAEMNWVSINPSLGVVLYDPRQVHEGASPRTAVGGRLMAKVNGAWFGVDLGDSRDYLRVLPAR